MRTCEVPGCGNRHLAHGYCVMHYRRVRRHGDLGFINTWKYFPGELPPSEIPIGWVPPDAGRPQPYSVSLCHHRKALEARDVARDRRDLERWPEYLTEYRRQAARWRGDVIEEAA